MGLAKRGTVFLMAVVAVALCGVSRAAEYKVGDSAGWTIPAGGGVDYQAWASNHKFYVGDTLVFKYNMQYHDVRQGHVEDYKSCTTETSIATFQNGSDYITLKSSGEYYFLCGYPGHCQAGQKVHITVNDMPAPGNQGLGPNASPASTSPPKSAAPSLRASKLSCLAIITYDFLAFFLWLV